MRALGNQQQLGEITHFCQTGELGLKKGDKENEWQSTTVTSLELFIFIPNFLSFLLSSFLLSFFCLNLLLLLEQSLRPTDLLLDMLCLLFYKAMHIFYRFLLLVCWCCFLLCFFFSPQIADVYIIPVLPKPSLHNLSLKKEHKDHCLSYSKLQAIAVFVLGLSSAS